MAGPAFTFAAASIKTSTTAGRQQWNSVGSLCAQTRVSATESLTRKEAKTFFLGQAPQFVSQPNFLRAHKKAAPHNGQLVIFCSAAALTQDQLKQLAAEKAVDKYFKSGMVLGLGTGSTAAFAVAHVGKKLKEGTLTDIIAVPTSVATAEQAKSLGIPLTTLDLHPKIDVTIDGSDEVDPNLQLVKGRGGALLREKMVELASDKFVVIVDESKLVPGLGISGAMPVEVTQFCWDYNRQRILSELGVKAKLRSDGSSEEYRPYVTDNSNYIVDLYYDKPIEDPAKVSELLLSYVGVVEHGLFLNMATSVIVAGKDSVYELTHSDPKDFSSPVNKVVL